MCTTHWCFHAVVLQGEKSSEEFTPGVYWSLQSNDHVSFFFCRTSPLAKAQFCRVLSPAVRHQVLLVPCHQWCWRAVIILQECLTSFRNAEHLTASGASGLNRTERGHALHLAQSIHWKDMKKFFMLDY